MMKSGDTLLSGQKPKHHIVISIYKTLKAKYKAIGRDFSPLKSAYDDDEE